MAEQQRVKFVSASLVLMALAACSGNCGRSKSAWRAPMSMPNEDLPRELKPLPEPPQLNIPRERLASGAGLVVVTARPKGEVHGEVRPTVTFSKPVKSLESIESSSGAGGGLSARIEPAIEGEWKWLGSASVEFIPRGRVPYSTRYRVTIAKGLRAIDGNQLKQDYAFEFSTPNVELQDVSPLRGYRWIKPDQTIRLLLNQPVKDSDLAAAASFRVEGEKKPWRVQVMSRSSVAEERRKLAEAARREGRLPDTSGPSTPLRYAQGERGENQQTRYELAPEKPFPLNRTVALTLSKSLHGEEGSLPMDRDESLEWKVYGPLELLSARMCRRGYDRCPYGPLVIYATNRVELATIKQRLKISPPVEIDWERAESWSPHEHYGSSESPYLMLPGSFRPGTAYKVSIAPGISDEFDQKYDRTFSEEMRTDDLRPALYVGGEHALIESSSGPKLPIELVNLKTLEVEIWKLTLPEVARLTARHPYQQSKPLGRSPDLSERIGLTYRVNETPVHPVDLGKALGKHTGIALVALNSPDLERRPEHGFRTIAQVTDLAVHVKVAPKKSLAWVTRISTGGAVGGAEVSVYDASGKMLWSGKANGEGLVDVPGAATLGFKDQGYAWQYPYLLVAAEKDGDIGITADTWVSGIEPYEFGLQEGWEGTQPEPNGIIFTDRGIYRPGDKVHIKGIVRFRQLGELKTPAEGSAVNLVVTDSRRQKLATEKVTVTKYGTFSANVDIAKDSPTGQFSVTASGTVPGGTVSFGRGFRVEEYRAPQFKVDVAADETALIAGDALSAHASARYLFGGAMSNAKVRWSVHRQSTTFAPAQEGGYVFGQETWWWDDRRPEPSSNFFASGNGAVDAKGTFEIEAGVLEAPGERPWTYTIEVEVEDVNRQSVAGRSEVMVHPAKYYVGLRAPHGFAQAGRELALEALVVDSAGHRTRGREVAASVFRRTWKSVRKRDAGGGFLTVSEPAEDQVHTCMLQSDEQPLVCRFKPESAGFYIVRATVEDEQKRKHTASIGLYVTGPGFVAWQRNDTDRIELVPDKASYDVGDVAHVLIKSPYLEANALLTVEREGVLERRPLLLKGSVVTVDVPIREEMVPNVYASVLLMRPRVYGGGIESGADPGRPNVRVGWVNLLVEKKTKRLSVSVTTDQQEYRPLEEVTVNIDVRDHAGRGAAAEVTVYAVDESVLRLTGYQTPDPIAAIFPMRPLSVRLGEPLLHLVRRRGYGEKGEAQGGGGGASTEGTGFRSRFQTTVLFRPAVETSSAGKAQIKFQLPDNLTAFRVMAVAVTPRDRFGSGQASIKVNKPLLALPAMPRFARVGDRFEAGVVVHAYGGEPGQVTVTASAINARLLGTAVRKTEIDPSAPKEVRFAFAVDSPGVATFRFHARKGPDQDGVEEKIPIELPVSVEAVATYGDTQTERVEGVTPPREVWSGIGGLNITMASTALGNFQQGMQQLVDYPYGCLEQQSSRLVPFIALREVAGKFGIAWQGPDPKKLEARRELNAFFRSFLFDALDVSHLKDPDQVIAATVASILKLQEPDGSFKYWSDAWCADSWASAYATMALARASQVGYAVSPESLARAEGFLTRVAGGGCHPCEHWCPDETRVFATYVLARMGKPKPSYYGEFFLKRKELPLFTQALLADAMFIGGGDRVRANALLQELLNHAKESPKGVHFEEAQRQTYATLWHSDARTTGAVLQTLSDVAPDHPLASKIAHYLTGVRQGDGRWRSTQEAAFSLMGLTQLVSAKEKDKPDFKATVSLGGQHLAERAFRGRSMEVAKQSVALEALTPRSADSKLVFKKEGPGVLYYSALLRYAPKGLPMTPVDRGLFIQRWFEPYSGGGQATKFYAGDLVRVRVRVATNQERHWTAFEVPLPAGLEAVDTSLATTARLGLRPGEEKRDLEYAPDGADDQISGSAYESEMARAEEEGGSNPWTYSFWSPFNHVEQRDSKVVLFADHLPPGIHVASFVARATTPGTYLLLPARGELMYEPEVSGRSEGGKFEITLPEAVSER